MARISAVEVDQIYNYSIDSFWLSNIYLVQYPYQANLNFICFSYNELSKELKTIKHSYVPVVFEVQTFGKPKIKKLSSTLIKQLIK